MISQVTGVAVDQSQHQLPEASHRAGDGEAGDGGLGGRGVRPELRPPQPRHRPQGHHAGVHGAAPSTGETIQQNEFVLAMKCTNVCIYLKSYLNVFPFLFNFHKLMFNV